MALRHSKIIRLKFILGNTSVVYVSYLQWHFGVLVEYWNVEYQPSEQMLEHRGTKMSGEQIIIIHLSYIIKTTHHCPEVPTSSNPCQS